MKKYEIKKEKVEVLARVCALIECYEEELQEEIERRATIENPSDWDIEKQHQTVLRRDTVIELLDYLQSNDSKLPWNK